MTSYLILHKVRGEPAFDVAEQMEVGDEVWWIIPTSGHRAYPAKHWELANLSYEFYPPHDLPDDLRDHYEYLPEPSVKTTRKHKETLARLGFKVKPEVHIRRLG